MTTIAKKLDQPESRADKLMEVSKLLNSEHSAPKILEMIMDTAIETLNADRGFLILKKDEKITFPVARNMDREDISKAKYKVSKTIAERVIQTGVPLLTDYALEEENLKLVESVQEMKLSSVICVPLKIKGNSIGAIYLDNRHKKGAFQQDDLLWLNSFGDHAGIALSNADLLEELEDKNRQLIELSTCLKEKNLMLNETVISQQEELSLKQQSLEWKYDYSKIIGNSTEMQNVFSLVDKVVDNSEPVVILGESGTGKELIAKAIHFNGSRKKYNFVSENCAALTPTLIESELFGHMKGSFTGADNDKIGLFQQANGGTIFLDEIGDLDIDLQRKLLRVLQEKEVRPVGSKNTFPIDVRIIVATHRDLERMVKEGKFREDLYYRLNVLSIQLPPLRTRTSDIPLLIDHFLKKISEERSETKKEISQQAMTKLCNFSWPGNVRQLENEVRKAVALSEKIIQPKHLSKDILDGTGTSLRSTKFSYQGGAIESVMGEVEKQIIQTALEKASGNKAETARMLQITRATLYDKLKKYNLF